MQGTKSSFGVYIVSRETVDTFGIGNRGAVGVGVDTDGDNACAVVSKLIPSDTGGASTCGKVVFLTVKLIIVVGGIDSFFGNSNR